MSRRGGARDGARGGHKSNKRGGSGTHGSPSPTAQREQSDESRVRGEELKKMASTLFSCPRSQLQVFTEQVDPFNPKNSLEGLQCRQDGPFFGSLLITKVNDRELPEPLAIFGTPKIEPLPPRPPSDPTPVQFYLANKWNGLNVLYFKYKDADGVEYVTCKTRGYVFARDYPGGKVFTHPLKILGLTQEQMTPGPNDSILPLSSLPSLLKPLTEEDVQSISFELCGSEEPSLVKYSFPLDLKPLFLTSSSGRLRPIISPHAQSTFKGVPSSSSSSLEEKVAALSADFGPMPFGKSADKATDLGSFISDFKSESLKVNEEFRANNKIDNGYYFNSFAIEGKVLFLLDSEGFVLNREMIFKIKAPDVEASHAPIFDFVLQAKVVEALSKVYSRGHEGSTEEALRMELDMSEREWIRFGKDAMDLIEGIPNTASKNYEPSDQKMLMMVGIPGSGKSTIAKRLIEETGGEIWVRVNQDELGTRQACENVARTALKKGYSIIVDRCNFDIKQRNNWIKLAAEFGVNDIRALFLDISPEVAKERVFNREGHPTIPKGDLTAQGIIDKFSKWQMQPVTGEGFFQVIRASSDADIESALLNLKELIKTPELEEGWSHGKNPRGRAAVSLKKSGKIAEDGAGSASEKPRDPKRPGKAPDVIAFNPFDALGDDE